MDRDVGRVSGPMFLVADWEIVVLATGELD
jgi:hypothetical protein